MPTRSPLRRFAGLVGACACLAACGGGAEGAPDPTAPSATVEHPTSTGPTSAISPDALPFHEPSSESLPAEVQADLQALLDGVVVPIASEGAHGVTAAVVTADGTWAGAAGLSGDGTALEPTAMVPIASITKTFVAVEIMHLVDQGLIDLDTPASAYVDHPLLGEGATVRQLLSMTSGIADYNENPAAFADWYADPSRQWSADEVLAYVMEPAAEPGGTVPRYSNSNYHLLGKVIEAVTGLGYAAAMRRDILGDGLERVAVQDAEAPTPPLALPEPDAADDAEVITLPNRSVATFGGPAGGMAADAPSLATFGYRIYGGLAIAPEDALEMTTPVASGQLAGPGTPYGLGTQIWNKGSRGIVVGHQGGTLGHSTELVVDPTRQICVVVLMSGELSPATLVDLILDVASGR